KIRLHGQKLTGDFALIHIRGRRPGSKGTEWLLIKKHDEYAVEGYDIEKYDVSVLSKRTMAEIAGDEDSAQWKSSRPASRGKVKAPWLAETLAKDDKEKRKKKTSTEITDNTEKSKTKKNSSVPPASSVVKDL